MKLRERTVNVKPTRFEDDAEAKIFRPVAHGRWAVTSGLIQRPPPKPPTPQLKGQENLVQKPMTRKTQIAK
jgi:hypothetical protein